MRLQRNSDMHKIDCLEIKKALDAQKEKVEPKRAEIKPQGTVKSKGIGDQDNFIQGKSRILSAGGGVVKDTGGPTKHIKSETSNTVWNPDAIEKMTKDKGSDEESKENKESIKALRDKVRHADANKLAEQLKDTDTRNGSTVMPATSQQATSFNAQAEGSGLSIFDDSMDFDRVPEKTAGEKLTGVAKRRAQRKADREWAQKHGTTSTKKITSSMFDGLLGQNDK